jgi:predicted lipoprotein with Yx(FWY)xxD motif
LAVGLAAIGLTFVPPGDPAHQGSDAVLPAGFAADTGAVEIAVARHDTLGQYLTDGDGRAVYLFKADTAGESACYDQCAGAWPPLLTEGEPQAGDGVRASLLGTTQRRDGSSQVTYNDWPLYYFTQDTGPNSVKGQDKSGFGAEWYLVSPSGEEVHERKSGASGALHR